MSGLFARALLAFLALPGVVAFAVPLLLVGPSGPADRTMTLASAPVLYHEEPFLARTHGHAWTAYVARVPRWIGRAARAQRVAQP